MITFAKGVTSGTVPMAGVIVRKGIYDAFMRGPEHVIELFHGYTYSAHPLACAAGIATLDVYRDEKLFERAGDAGGQMGRRRDVAEGHARRARHPHARPGRGDRSRLAARRVRQARLRRRWSSAFHEHGLMFRITGDTIALSPPLIISENEIGEIFDKVGKVIRAGA